MSRPSYRREMATSLTLPIAISLTEGGVAGVVAKRVFQATGPQVATIIAAGMFANLTSFLWARATRGRRKVASIASMIGATGLCVGAVSLLPTNTLGAWGLVALVVIARCLLVGVLTVRSTVWRHNYPRGMRARITGRLALAVNIVLLIAPLIGAVVLDANQEAFRALYIVGGLAAAGGMWAFSGLRLRGERALLAFEQRPGVQPTRHGDAVGIYEYDDRPNRRPGLLAILRHDPMFRRYMLWQFMAGMSNMMVETVLVEIATKETESLNGGFFIGMTLTHGLPVLLSVITLPMWAVWLDRVHIARFRVSQAWLWTVSQLIIWVGAVGVGQVWLTILLLALGRIVLGVARGGGVLAWNLGHNDFASREMVAAYMGVHVTLTGVRGAFAPFLGMALYTGWAADSWGGRITGAFPGIGGHVFALSAIFSFASVIGFWMMERQLRHGPARHLAD